MYEYYRNKVRGICPRAGTRSDSRHSTVLGTADAS